MKRLCRDSSRPYLGRSAPSAPPLSHQRSGRTAHGNVARDVAETESDEMQRRRRPAGRAESDERVQSAEGIVASNQARLVRHSKVERRRQRIGRAATIRREGLN
jgi:hypothetical protein